MMSKIKYKTNDSMNQSQKFSNFVNIRNPSKTPVMCTYCGQEFKRKKGLRRHEKVHTSKKTSPCNFCGKMFHRKDHLLDHIKSHLDEKPFACKYCTKKFSKKFNMKSHEIIHTGEKPFSCQLCIKGIHNSLPQIIKPETKCKLTHFSK